MTRIHNESAATISTALLALLLAACTSTGPGATNGSARSAENQKKQTELKGMEAVGQRNDIDKPLK